ncbi:hypothetical protein CBM2618_B200129 [Cupriavidus taiwanensis]|nr:hypothetical protein CBM2618_B200129 [Cupriavidus taiwanensis]
MSQGDLSACTGLVLKHHRHCQGLLQAVAEWARHKIRRPPRRIRYDDGDWLIWVSRQRWLNGGHHSSQQQPAAKHSRASHHGRTLRPGSIHHPCRVSFYGRGSFESPNFSASVLHN